MTAKPEITSIRSVAVTAQKRTAQIDVCASFVMIAIG
jgi:hypothetical protein